MKKTLLSALVGAVVLTGCSSNDKVPTVVTERTLVFEEDNRRYIHSIATTAYGNKGLGGAAVLQPATIHVMADERRTADIESLADFAGRFDLSDSFTKAERESLNQALNELSKSKESGDEKKFTEKLEKAMKTLAIIQASDKKTQLSHYDLELWEKFCSGGEDMTNDDWGQMLSSSVEQIPDVVKSDCSMPNLTLTTEIEDRHCDDSEQSNRDRFIIQEYDGKIECE
jgi:hypothetical protein